MLPYLYILIRIEENESLQALGAFTTKEKLEAYQTSAGLEDSQIRLDFFNGPFEEQTLRVVYAGHRRWNMDQFQLGGYFLTEGEAWNCVSQEGYVSVLRIDTTYEAEQALQQEALELYNSLQKRWRLVSFEELVAREGAEKARANITLRFYEDALESFRPKSARETRALKGLLLLIPIFPLAFLYFMRSIPEYGENVSQVDWLPAQARNISYYLSREVEAYEFDIPPREFILWSKSKGMTVGEITAPITISRYFTYMPEGKAPPERQIDPPEALIREDGSPDTQQLQKLFSASGSAVTEGLIAEGEAKMRAVYDARRNRAYFEHILPF